MPTYEYVCDACGNEFELEQRISEAPAKKCPKCGKQKARRQISNSGRNFILKGGGWYSDLYATPSGNSSKGSDDSDSGSGSSGSKASASSAGESKSESSADTSSKKTEKAKADSKPAKKSSAKKAK